MLRYSFLTGFHLPFPPLNTIFQAYRGNILSQTIDFFNKKSLFCQKCKLIKHINVFYENYFSFARPKPLLFANNKESRRQRVQSDSIRYTRPSVLKSGPALTWLQVTNIFSLKITRKCYVNIYLSGVFHKKIQCT